MQRAETLELVLESVSHPVFRPVCLDADFAAWHSMTRSPAASIILVLTTFEKALLCCMACNTISDEMLVMRRHGVQARINSKH